MCGKEIHGLAAADVDLYRGQTFILCRTARTGERVWQVALAMLDLLEARLLELEPAQHDQYVAVVSHLPYVLSATLLRRAALAAIDDPQVWQVSASGFRDTGRLAGSEPRMMLDILLTNKEAVLAQLDAFREHLEEVTRLIEAGDEVALRQWLNDRQYEHGIYWGHKKPGAGEGD
jgi:prephenate dehydrogenase